LRRGVDSVAQSWKWMARTEMVLSVVGLVFGQS